MSNRSSIGSYGIVREIFGIVYTITNSYTLIFHMIFQQSDLRSLD